MSSPTDESIGEGPPYRSSILLEHAGLQKAHDLSLGAGRREFGTSGFPVEWNYEDAPD
jgi:hypothetical protein